MKLSRYTPMLVFLAMLALVASIFAIPFVAENPAHAETIGEVKAAIEEAQQTPRGRALRRNEVRTQHLLNGSVTGPKLAIKAKAITVTAAGTTGSSAADPDCTTAGGALILGFRQTGNQDQHLDNLVLNADGSVTATLAAAATANNTFSVAVACHRGQF